MTKARRLVLASLVALTYDVDSGDEASGLVQGRLIRKWNADRKFDRRGLLLKRDAALASS